MQVVKQLQKLNEALPTESNGSIGFVPTMGFLHQGHRSLINERCPRCRKPIVGTNPIDLLDSVDKASFSSWSCLTICITYYNSIKATINVGFMCFFFIFL